MKVLIIYASRGGTCKRCAEMLCEKLCGFANVTVCDIAEQPPAPDGYDVAVIGGSVRMGKINKALKKYLRENASALNGIGTALFLCCGFTENFDSYVAMQFPKSVIPSLGTHCFGGELKPEKLKGLDKMLVKMMRSEIRGSDFEAPEQTHAPMPEIVPENIYRLADKIRALL